jgi:hypothetical protein
VADQLAYADGGVKYSTAFGLKPGVADNSDSNSYRTP